MYLLAAVEPVQECDLDLGAELISGRKSIRWNRHQRRHIVVLLALSDVLLYLPRIVVLYK
jgi:hypothetical protein